MRGTKTKNAEVAKSMGNLPCIEVVELDVTDEESVRLALEHILARYQKVDALINNAGVIGNERSIQI